MTQSHKYDWLRLDKIWLAAATWWRRLRGLPVAHVPIRQKGHSSRSRGHVMLTQAKGRRHLADSFTLTRSGVDIADWRSWWSIGCWYEFSYGMLCFFFNKSAWQTSYTEWTAYHGGQLGRKSCVLVSHRHHHLFVGRLTRVKENNCKGNLASDWGCPKVTSQVFGRMNSHDAHSLWSSIWVALLSIDV